MESADDVEVVEVEDEVIAEMDHDPDWEDVDEDEETMEGEPPTLTFSQHKEPAICCDLDRAGKKLVVSGGQDNSAFVWDMMTGEVVMDCSAGLADTALSVGFSSDGKYVGTGDMSGQIIVWDVVSKTKHWSQEVDELNWLLWHPLNLILAAGTVRGDVWLWALPGSNQKIFANHGSETHCGHFFPDGKRAIIGYNDGAVKIFDLKEGKAIHQFQGNNGHSDKVVALDCHSDNQLALTGSIDGNAKLINSQSGKIVATLDCDTRADPEENDSVETVAFSPKQPWLAVGTLAEHIHVWDIPSQKQRLLCKNESGITRMAWHPTSPMIVSGDVDGAVRLWDLRSGNCERTWVGHRQTILDMQLSSDGKYAVTAADDGKCCVFTVDQ